MKIPEILEWIRSNTDIYDGTVVVHYRFLEELLDKIAQVKTTILEREFDTRYRPR